MSIRTRRIGAGIRAGVSVGALITPSVVVVSSAIVWHGTLPNRLPVHWSSNGPADRFNPPEVILFAVAVWLVIATVPPIIVACIPQVDSLAKRLSITAGTVISAVACSHWLVPCLIAGAAQTQDDTSLGLWIAPLFGSALWGIVPLILFPRPAQRFTSQEPT